MPFSVTQLTVPDLELIAIINQTPDQGLDLLIRQRFPIITGLLRKKGFYLNHTQDEDLSAELMAQAWESINRFDPAKGSLNTWLCTIAERIVIAEFNEEQRHPESCDYLDELSAKPEVPSVTTEMKRDALHRCIEHLPRRQRTLTRLDIAASSGRADTKEAMVAVGAKTPNAIYVLRQRAAKNMASPHRHQRLHSLMRCTRRDRSH
jgi:RNA polymerase sigma factor (sigma-70 family)